jgi:hypothetical protein
MQKKKRNDKVSTKDISGLVGYMIYEGSPVFKEEIDKKTIRNKRKK